MSYSVRYEPDKERNYSMREHGYHKTVVGLFVTILIIGFFIFGLKSGWLIPGDSEVTVSAFWKMVDDIENGNRVEDAVTVFCMDVIEHGKPVTN